MLPLRKWNGNCRCPLLADGRPTQVATNTSASADHRPQASGCAVLQRLTFALQVCGQAPAWRCLGVLETAVTAQRAEEGAPETGAGTPRLRRGTPRRRALIRVRVFANIAHVLRD